MRKELEDLRYALNEIIGELRYAFNTMIDEFKKCISTIINISLEVESMRKKVKEHKTNYRLFKHRYRKTNILNSQVYNSKRICRCRCRSDI